MGNLLIVECQINTAMERKRSKPLGAQFCKKKENQKRRKYSSLYDYGIHVINEGLMLIGGITLTLMSYVC